MNLAQVGMSLLPGVDSRTAKAIRRCFGKITPSHSMTSRRHSISTLVRRELDGEIERVIRAYCAEQDVVTLMDFRLSQVWRHSPEAYAAPPEHLHAVAAAQHRAKQWHAVVKLAIRQASMRKAARRSSEASRFRITMGAVLDLIDVLSTMKPAHTQDKDGRRVSLRAAGSQQWHCELCWRPTMRAVAGDPRDASENRLGASRRFCAEHSPQQAASRYRRDLQYKPAFDGEVKFLMAAWRKIKGHGGPVVVCEDPTTASGGEVHLVPVTAAPTDIRRAAYALVHGKLQGNGSQCWILKHQGASIRQIAASLEMTERAVRSALAAFETKLARANIVRQELSDD